ncbi:MAG: hypothetical protein ACYCZF_16260 [Anaerolineae bacterium]
MNHTPVAIPDLLARYQRESRQLASTDSSAERLCQDYIVPLLIALGWDVANRAGVREANKPVEMLILPVGATDRWVYAFLLHEQSYRYWRHYLIGVSQPPLAQHSADVLTALEPTLNHSSVLIETLALTDFERFCFYDNTPGTQSTRASKRALLYSLSCRHYPAWWEELRGWNRLGFRKRDFDLYAAKLRNWAGIINDPDNTGDIDTSVES